MNQINDLELAVRTIENILTEMPNKSLEKWHAILTTALAKIEREMSSTKMHVCSLCGYEEYGYRADLPVAWRQKENLTICFNHENNEVANLNKPVDTEKTLDELMALI